MSKPTKLAKDGVQKTALRNIRAHRITKQIQQLLNTDSSLSSMGNILKQNHSIPKQNQPILKQNHSILKQNQPILKQNQPHHHNHHGQKSAPKQSSPIRPQSISTGEVDALRARVLALQVEAATHRMEKETHIRQKEELISQMAEMLKESQAERQRLHEQIQQLKGGQCGQSYQQQSSLLIREESGEFHDDFRQLEFSPDMIELHEENSKLLSKIIELTSKQGQGCGSQTQSTARESTGCQTESPFWSSAERFCARNGICIGSTVPSLDDQFETYLTAQVEKQLHPLRCELQLFQQIISTNKRQHQEREARLTTLLKDSQRTIQNLIVQMRQFEAQSKLNHSKYLAIARATRDDDNNL